MYNTTELIKKFENGENVILETPFPNELFYLAINSLLIKILSRLDRLYLLDTISTAVREMVLNAAKANAKRVYFRKQSLDITHPEDYTKGMAKFKKIINNLNLIKEEVEQSAYRIRVAFTRQKNHLCIEIINNAKITWYELEKINFRLKEAWDCQNFSDAYNIVYDPAEGAGLGIILTLLLFKNSGIDLENFKIISEDDQVRVSIAIPYSLQGVSITSRVRDMILEEVKNLPTFPEHVIELQKLCSDPDVSIETIGGKLSLDPSLTADVFRLSNSAGFLTGKRVENINEAIMVIGLKNLSALLTALTAKRILDKKYKRFQQIWEHCNKTAVYAKFIASSGGQNKIANSAFIAGLLHDIGKIVLLSVDQELIRELSRILKNHKIITTSLVEEISIGISHASIGGEIARKWNFPEYLCETISHHHAPLNAGPEFKNIVTIVYLANSLCVIESKNGDLSYVESDVLEKYGINEEKKFKKFHRALMLKYQNSAPL